MAKRNEAIQQEAMPSVVYEYVYDILKDKLTITKHGVRRGKNSLEDVVLDNGTMLNPMQVFGCSTPTLFLFTRGTDRWNFCPECAFLAGYSWERLKRSKVHDVARRISKNLFEGRIADLSRRVEEVRADMNKACKELQAMDALYRAHVERMEKTDE
jgi:hypothetical protein